jgi:hypothetical protein
MSPAKPQGPAMTISRSLKAWHLGAFLQRWGEESATSGNEPSPYVATLTSIRV